MKKLVNGILVDLTAEEITARQAEETAWSNGALDRALEKIRFERNVLLVETDYLALGDVTMSSDMKTYRQELRDITNGLNTVEKIKIKLKDFPTKPSGS